LESGKIESGGKTMNWQMKTRFAAPPSTASAPGPKTVSSLAPATANGRVSNGLKEFLWLLSDAQRGKLLDLGQVSQNTLNFFIAKGFRVSTEDFMRSWRDFMDAEEERRRKTAANGNDSDWPSFGTLAARFVEDIFQFPAETYSGILAWDLFDYMEPELLSLVVARLHEMLRPGGVVLAMFHSRPPDHFCRYRILENQTFELMPTQAFGPHVRVFQNREILELFGKFRTSKTFVGRDQIREAIFIK
jgi:hypothetical protein